MVVFLAFSNSGVAFGQQTPWVSKTDATEFVNNFLQTYYFDVSQFHLMNPNKTLTGHFVLYYEEADRTFNVTVMRLLTNTSDYVGFVFTPIVNNAPLTYVDDTDSVIPRYVSPVTASAFNDFEPTNGLGVEMRQGLFTGPNGSGYLPFIWIGYTSRLLADPMGYSAQVAQYAFNDDVRSYPNASTTTTSTSESGPIALIWWILGGIVVIAGIVVAVLLAFFGSLREALRVLTNREEQKKLVQEVDEAFRRDVNRGKPKPKTKKPPEDKEQERQGEDNESSPKGE